MTPISLETFRQLELRVGTVVRARAVERDRVLWLEVDLGTERRPIIAPIAKFYEPEEVVGKQVVVLTNLWPAVIHGQRTHGMVLLAHSPGGILSLVSVDRAVLPGSPVGDGTPR